MNRSKCVICGKVRKQLYLAKQNELSGCSVWVCAKSVGFSYDHVRIGDMGYVYSKCELYFFKKQHESLIKQKEIYEMSIKKHPVFGKVDQNLYVSPELTFLLQ